MKLAKYVKFREEKFGGVLFETRSEKVFTLNPTAAAIVGEIVKGGEESDILERLKGSFNDAQQTMESEAAAFIAELRDNRLVEE